MAYGLKIFSPDGADVWFDSQSAFGFIEITSFSVSTDGTTTNSASGTLVDYSAIYPIYVPASIQDAETDTDTKRPVISSTFNSGTGAWTCNQTWSGTAGTTTAMGGGRVIIFAN